MLTRSLRRSRVRRDRLSSSPLAARIRGNGRPVAAELMACDAAGRKHGRPPPRQPLSRPRGRCWPLLLAVASRTSLGPITNEFGPHLWILDELNHE